MTHIIRQQPNGLWCIYSTVSEDIILYEAEKEDVIEYELQERKKKLEQKLEKIEEHGYNPPETNRTKSFEDIVEKSELELTDGGELVDPAGDSEEVEEIGDMF